MTKVMALRRYGLARLYPLFMEYYKVPIFKTSGCIFSKIRRFSAPINPFKKYFICIISLSHKK